MEPVLNQCFDGVEVPPPPTAQAVIDWGGEAVPFWVPSGVLLDAGLPMSRVEELLRECPEFPPSYLVLQH